MPPLKFVKLLLILLLCSGSAGAADSASVAWLRDGKVEIRALNNESTPLLYNADQSVPLGSLWKLFVYDYLVETNGHGSSDPIKPVMPVNPHPNLFPKGEGTNVRLREFHVNEPVFHCSLKNTATMDETRYCCHPGGSIDRDSALAHSCAAYFSPVRLKINHQQWQAHWRVKAPWLLNIEQLKPETMAPLKELLQVLASISPTARDEARTALLPVSIEGYGRDAWTQLGSGIRYKTYSWHTADGSALGGAAGWLADGTPFWFGASGSSRTALTKWAGGLAKTLPEPVFNSRNFKNSSCVDVDFFARYPLTSVWQKNTKIEDGHLHGSYRLQFANGNWLSIVAAGEMRLQNTITGRFTINDYVARVIDREGDARSIEAGRALAIAARSYLLQNAQFAGGCWQIRDASNTQRVSPNPPSSAALSAAWFTDDLVLKGAQVHYHGTSAGNNRMSWRDAVEHAKHGWDFERILLYSYPKATIATLNGERDCRRLNAAQDWLANAIIRWKTKLLMEPGFEAFNAPPVVCELNEGHPYSDQQRMRIYVRGWQSLDEHITLAHEYLHLAFRFHPDGADEDYIERLARRLIEG